MSTIHNLNTSITDMSPDECFSLIKKIRSSRRTPIKRTKSSRSTDKKKTVDISSLMKSMSSSDKKAILKDLEKFI